MGLECVKVWYDDAQYMVASLASRLCLSMKALTYVSWLQ
jgi:hypothetical protein